MSSYKVKSPVAIIIFNRPDKTYEVFKRIKQVKPSKLFIIADGPRNNNPDDFERCQSARQIFDNIDWDCEVYKNFSKINLGCGKRPATGISWVFENCDRAIILEDDCLPDESFFRFCDEMLEYYKDDERIMLISGTNPLKRWKKGTYSYHFSVYGGIHGWASWQRAWKYFDMDIKLWNDINVKKGIKNLLNSKLQYFYRATMYDRYYNKSSEVSAWDFQWGFARMAQNGLAIVPCVNLISNIGFGDDSTHTKNNKHKLSSLPVSSMEFPIKHPPFVLIDKEYDNKFFTNVFGPKWKIIIGTIIRKIILYIEKISS